MIYSKSCSNLFVSPSPKKPNAGRIPIPLPYSYLVSRQWRTYPGHAVLINLQLNRPVKHKTFPNVWIIMKIIKICIAWSVVTANSPLVQMRFKKGDANGEPKETRWGKRALGLRISLAYLVRFRIWTNSEFVKILLFQVFLYGNCFCVETYV